MVIYGSVTNKPHTCQLKTRSPKAQLKNKAVQKQKRGDKKRGRAQPKTKEQKLYVVAARILEFNNGGKMRKQCHPTRKNSQQRNLRHNIKS